jgi:hypothetical protein
MADATALAELAILSTNGEGERPAGDAMEVGRMKSSRFMASMVTGGVCRRVDFRNCAMPLGAEVDEVALVDCFLRLAFLMALSVQSSDTRHN